MQGKALWPVAKQAVTEWTKDKVPKLSAALAYYTFLSLAPLLVVTVKILSVVLDEEAAKGQVQGQIQGLIGQQAAKAVQDMIERE